METVDLEQIDLYEAEPPFTRLNKIMVDNISVNNPPFSVGIGIYRQGEKAEMHAHAKEVEVMLFLKGSGIIRLPDGSDIELKPNRLLYFPPGEAHQIFNTGQEPLEFLFIYSPSGPEAGIRKWKTIAQRKSS